MLPQDLLSPKREAGTLFAYSGTAARDPVEQLFQHKQVEFAARAAGPWLCGCQPAHPAVPIPISRGHRDAVPGPGSGGTFGAARAFRGEGAARGHRRRHHGGLRRGGFGAGSGGTGGRERRGNARAGRCLRATAAAVRDPQ